MTTIATDLNWCQRFLKDTPSPGIDGSIWTRAELLGYYADGYRDFVAQSGAAKRYTVLEVPPQHTMAGTYSWEARYAGNGTFRPWTQSPAGTYACAMLFEIGIGEGAPSMPSSEAITQGWERSFLNPAFTPFRFTMQRNHLRVTKMWYAHRLLLPLATKELDWTYTNWYSLGNYPMAWVVGTDAQRTYEIYEIQTVDPRVYAQTRDSMYFSTPADGNLRSISGARTYSVSPDAGLTVPTTIGYAWSTEGDAGALQRSMLLAGDGLRLTGNPATSGEQGVHAWELQQVNGLLPAGTAAGGTAAGETADTQALGCYPWEVGYGAQAIPLALGTVRAIESPNRQYWAVPYWHDQVPLGKLDTVSSSEGLLVLEDIEPDAPALLPSDTPGLIPPQLQKYLRYYVLYRAFNRQGEGYMPGLAGVWQARFQLGLMTLRAFADIQRRDKTYARQPVVTRGRPPRPRLPGSYPSVWR